MRVADTAAEVQKRGSSGSVAAYTHDLSTLAGVRALAEAVKADHTSIDVLINNAGVFEEKLRCSVPLHCSVTTANDSCTPAPQYCTADALHHAVSSSHAPCCT